MKTCPECNAPLASERFSVAKYVCGRAIDYTGATASVDHRGCMLRQAENRLKAVREFVAENVHHGKAVDCSEKYPVVENSYRLELDTEGVDALRALLSDTG